MDSVAFNTLDRYLDADSPDVSTSVEGSRFPVNSAVNKRLVLWQGNLAKLEIDAVVNSSNESLTDRTGLCGLLHEAAGPELHQECMTLEGCRTGEAKITRGYQLPSKFVVHTVGPRYNVKYRTAAENALHSCYRSVLQVVKESGLTSVGFCCINSERKGYPREDAAHIALRTIRRFLERYGDSLDTIVLSVDNANDYDIYKATMPLYFPRTEEEEQAAIKGLPEDTGNEIGETVTEERKIRIGTFPTSGGTSADAGASSPANNAPTAYARPEGAAAAGGSPTGGSSSTAAASASAGGGFASMRGDPDAQRRQQASQKTKEQLDQEDADRLYHRYLRRAKQEDLSDIAALNIIKQTGVDKEGRPVIMIVSSHLPVHRVDSERVLLYIISVMDQVVAQDYSLVYVHTNMSSENQPAFAWLKKVYGIFNRKYKKNLKALYIVHPTVWLKMAFWFLTPFLSKKFWKKLTYVPKLLELFTHIDRTQVDIPEAVFEYDVKENGADYPVTATAQASNPNENL